MRVLIVGASGYVGRCLCKILSRSYQVFGTFYRNQVFFGGEGGCVDIRDEDAVQNLVKQIRPDVIFHLAWDLNDLEGCIVAGTKNLLRARNEYCSTSRFIFISTDAVFDGERGLYRESDVPAPIWPYGVAKRKAEVDTLAAGGTVVRTSLVYGFEPMDPRTAVLKRGLETGNFSYPYFSDEIRCPVFVDDLCDALAEIGEGGMESEQIIHVAGPVALNRFDFAVLLACYFGYDKSKVPGGLLSESRLVRPRDLSLDTGLARRILKTRLRRLEMVIG
ncbi:MAG: NAD(P)-dependent oxidoreductase [Deltaproteobacteria bacterium]|nr:NAD(P)-dependent oxidoreductase [Deltaproteobacteria bacterium]